MFCINLKEFAPLLLTGKQLLASAGQSRVCNPDQEKKMLLELGMHSLDWGCKQFSCLLLSPLLKNQTIPTTAVYYKQRRCLCIMRSWMEADGSRKKSVFQMVFILPVKKINPRLLDYISEVSPHFAFSVWNFSVIRPLSLEDVIPKIDGRFCQEGLGKEERGRVSETFLEDCSYLWTQ